MISRTAAKPLIPTYHRKKNPIKKNTTPSQKFNTKHIILSKELFYALTHLEEKISNLPRLKKNY